MLDEWRKQRVIGRVQPGNGQSLQRFRWWQLPGPALFYLRRGDGAERALIPDPASAEGRRARVTNNHPTASRMIAAASVVMLLDAAGN